MDKNDAKPKKKGNNIMNGFYFFVHIILVLTLLSDFKAKIASKRKLLSTFLMITWDFQVS